MEALSPDTVRDMWLAGGILVVAYVLIFSEVVHRTTAGILGAVAMVGCGQWLGFYSQTDAVSAIDANTMLLLLGMMMLVAMLRPTGAFDYMAIRIAKLAGGSPRRLLVYICLAVSVLSMFLDNVTTVIIFAPITVLITRMLSLNPAPFLMAEAMLSNIGGVATLVGDPPNIMIGSAANIDFTRFLVHMGPPVVVVWVFTVGLVLFLFRRSLTPSQPAGDPIDLDERRAITDPAALRRLLVAMAVVIGLFFVHHLLHLYPAYVSFAGLAIALALVRPDIEKVLGEVEWAVLLFFAALFVIVGGVEHSGLLDLIGQQLVSAASDPAKLLLTALVLMWVAAVLSAVVDNIPFTVTMIPIVAGLQTHGIDVDAFWWALAIGVGLGGNGTHIGATANIICVAESERCGIPEACITPAMWLRNGLPVMLVGLAVASAVFAGFFGYFS